MKDVLNWLATIFLQHVVLQLIASPFMAYALGWTLAIWGGVEVAFDSIPPLYWPTLSTIVIAVTLYPAFIAPTINWFHRRTRAYPNRVDSAYIQLGGAYKPEILNPLSPGNPAAMKELTQREVDLLRPVILKRRDDVPPPINVEDHDSMRQWYEFLRDERARVCK